MKPCCRPAVAAVLAVLFAACRGAPRTALSAEQLARLVDSLRPQVETAAGLEFRRPVRSAVTSREAVRAFLEEKVRKDFPPERLEGLQAAYQLLGLLPDTLDLQALLLDLYTEQVAGYYDPEASTLYAVRGGDPAQLRLILAHELVHALQHQYLPLDSLMVVRDDADRLAAIQAVLEGHATIASIRVLTPGQDVLSQPGFWDTYREQVRAQQVRMEVFRSAPLVLREGLVFPYLDGARFVYWWAETHEAALPSTRELPVSTEQVLHPERYADRDGPVALRFTDAQDDGLYEDTIGEFEIAVLLAIFRGADQASWDAPLGWDGDRYRVYRTPGGPALVWYVVWDGPQFAERFASAARPGFDARVRQGYRVTTEAIAIDGLAGVRVVHAPQAWAGWKALPEIEPRGVR